MDKNVLEGLIAQGRSQRQIASMLGCSQSLVKYWVHKHGLSPPIKRHSAAVIASYIDRGQRPPKHLESYCNVHGESTFIFQPSRGLQGGYRCRRCVSDQATQRMNEQRSHQKALLVEMNGNRCLDCGRQGHQTVFDFHHSEGVTKNTTIARLLNQTKWDQARYEAEKCILLCACCHRIRHTTTERADISVSARHRLKSELVKMYGSTCMSCTRSYPSAAYDFHHVDRASKKFHVSELVNNLRYADLSQEVVKCVLLCACCHREVEAGIRPCPPLLTLTPQNCLEYLRTKFPKSTSLRDLLEPRSPKTCPRCSTVIHARSEHCPKHIPRRSKIDWPPIDELRAMIDGSNYLQVGKRLGVSDNAVRKHVRKYD
jgi:hypothetical protein